MIRSFVLSGFVAVLVFAGSAWAEPTKVEIESMEREHSKGLDADAAHLNQRKSERDLKGAVQDTKRDTRDTRRRLDRLDRSIKRMERRRRFQ